MKKLYHGLIVKLNIAGINFDINVTHPPLEEPVEVKVMVQKSSEVMLTNITHNTTEKK